MHKNISHRLSMVAITKQGHTDLCESEASLVYIARPRPSRAVTLSQKERKKNRVIEVLQEFEASLENSETLYLKRKGQKGRGRWISVSLRPALSS